MSDRVILHVDCNSFFASVSLLYKPWLKDRPVAVGGDSASRHGIILAKNEPAKKYGIKTAMALWQARQLCPELVIIPPDYDKYSEFSKAVKAIFAEYTDQQEAFGSDESWLDVTGSVGLFGPGSSISKEIMQRVRRELGITVSVGHSWNKIFSKLGSDFHKPNGYTFINRTNYKDMVWRLPVEELLYVGPATARRLRAKYVRTIGELAAVEVKYLQEWFGKVGTALHLFATGQDDTPVSRENTAPSVKSVGNSAVTPMDLTEPEQVRHLIHILSESVGPRMREHGLLARTIEVWVCDNDMGGITRQRPLPVATNLNHDLAATAFQLFRDTYGWSKPVRKVGIRGANLVLDSTPYQCTFEQDAVQRERRDRLEASMDALNKRWPHCVTRAVTLADRSLVDIAKKEAERKFSPISWY